MPSVILFCETYLLVLGNQVIALGTSFVQRLLLNKLKGRVITGLVKVRVNCPANEFVHRVLDKLPVAQVGKFEQGLLAYMRSEGKAILDAIRADKQISDDTRAKLKAALDTFSKTFA